MLSSVFIDRPRLSIVISIVITLAGLIAMLALPIAQFPDIVPPQVQVTARYPGAGATVVEQTVAQPIESQVVGVDNMLYMKSTAGNDGSYTLTISFAVGTDPDINTVNVNNRVQLATPQLPEDVRRQGVTVKKKSSAILQVLAVYSPDQRYDTLFLSNYATINVLDNIKRVRGVGDAFLFGALDYSMRVWVSTDRMTSLGLTPNDIAKALQGQNIQAAVGRIGAQPSGDAQFQLNIQTTGRLTEPEEFANVVIRANPDSSYVRVRDIGRVELGARTTDSFGRFNGGPGALIAIFQAPGANALATAEGVQAVMQRLQAQFPDGVAYKTTYDSTAFVLESIDQVVHTLIEAFVLVVIVVFLFLGNLRATRSCVLNSHNLPPPYLVAKLHSNDRRADASPIFWYDNANKWQLSGHEMQHRKRPISAPDVDDGSGGGAECLGKPIRVGRLDTVQRVRLEACRVYREMRLASVDSQRGRRLIGCLTDIAALLERGELEARLEAIEVRLKHATDH